MPSFSKKAGAFLLLLVMTSSIITITTTTVGVAASSVVSTLERRVSHNKSNKKQGTKTTNEDEGICTIELFLGTSQYTNCGGMETEVNIACPHKGNAAAAAADGTRTKELCSYSEQPVLFDKDEAAPAEETAGCGDHGSFDPEMHLTRDHATGVCRLDFIPLTSTCSGASVLAFDGRFGVMVEAPLSTGLGFHNQEQNEEEDKNHKDNSGLLLRFSTDVGVTYYNKKDPRETFFFDRSSPSRTLTALEPCKPACPTETFGGVSSPDEMSPSNILSIGVGAPFETCWREGMGEPAKYCWTRSYRHVSEWGSSDKVFHYRCVPYPRNSWKPDTHGWHPVDQDDMQYVNPVTNPYSCGNSCTQQLHAFEDHCNSEDGLNKPSICPPKPTYSPTRRKDDYCVHDTVGSFYGVSTTTGSFLGDASFAKEYPFQTCYQYGDEQKYCWSNSFHSLSKYNVDLYHECIPVGDDWHDLDPKYVNPVTDPHSCGEPCQVMKWSWDYIQQQHMNSF